MLKSHYRDYATAAFRLLAREGSADRYRARIYNTALARRGAGGTGLGSPTEAAIMRAEQAVYDAVATIADRKFTRRQAERIAIDENAAPVIFEKACAGYIFRDMEIKRSEWVAGVYIYVQMYKRRERKRGLGAGTYSGGGKGAEKYLKLGGETR